MKKILHLLSKQALVWCLFLISGVMWGQTNPTSQTLPYNQGFGTSTFTTLPAGWAAWNGVSGAIVTTQTLAEASTPSGNATVATATASGTGGGVFGFASSSNARLYIQTSSNATNGVNQVALAINTTGRSNVTVAFDVEIINASPRTVGIVMQYRIGTAGTWTTASGTGNPYSQAGGTVGVKANPSIILPSNANDKPVVQLRWATWRGTESGNSSGVAIDNIAVTSTALNAAPVASNVSISGLPNTTVQLTGTYNYSDTESDADASTYKWYTATDAVGTNATAIAGATSTTFTLTATELAKYVRFGVLAASSTGTSPGTESFSSWIGPVTSVGSPSLSGGLLSNFTPACLNTTSDANSFTLSGSNLSGNVTVGALDGFSFSNTESGTYTSSLVLIPTGNALNTTVFVKFTPTAVQSYNGNISVSGGGATAITVSVTASGINTPATASTTSSYDLQTNSATAEGSLTAGCSVITQYGIEYSTTNNFVNGTGTKVASNNINAGNFTATLTGLLSSTTYYYKGYATNATETVYGTQNTFITAAVAAPVATAATSITQTGFTANWNAVAGATGYELDVYKKVIGTFPNLVQNFGFESGNLTSWTFESSMNEVVSTTQAKSGTSSLYTTVIATKNFKQTISVENATEYVLKFSYFIDNTATGNGFRVWTTVGTDIKLPSISTFYNEKGSWVTVEHTFTTTGPSLELNFRLYNGVKIYFDDIQINKSQSIPVLNYVSGFEDLNVGNVTTKNITSLDSESEYFYRVRATDGAPSANSNEISVTTLGSATTYANGAWTNGVPTATVNAIIDDNFTTTGDLSVKSLTINSGKVFTVATGSALTISNAITNNAGLTGFVVESDGVVLQNSTTANTALATVKRNSTSLFLSDYTLWSSPVFEPNLRAFSAQTLFNRFYSYDFSTAVAGAYKQEIMNTNDVDTKKFISGKGYLIRMPNNANAVGTTAQSFQGLFKGNLNNGEIQIPLYGVVPSVSNGFNLVGNPYASPIKISEFMAVNNGKINGTMYFWRKKASANDPTNQISGYATYNAGGMVSADAAIQGQTLTHIKPGQGFFVQAIGASPGNLVFNNGMREKASTLFFKSSPENLPELHRFWLNLSNETNVVGQTLVAYATDATEAVDSNYDALYFNDSPLALTSIVNNNEYIIQGRSLPFLNTDVVSLGFKTDVAGSYTIALSNFDGLFTDNQDIFLKDKSANTLHNLKTSSYSFTSPIGVFNDRFEVRYNSVLGTNNPILAANTILIGVKNQQIKINAGSVTMEKIELIDLSGRVLFTLNDVDASTATIENLYSSNQMLIVRISTKENGVVSQKIIF